MYPLLKDLNKYNDTLSCYTFGEYLHLSINNDDALHKKRLMEYLQLSGHLHVEIYP